MNEADFKTLVSGEKRGGGASLFRAGLRFLSFGYAGGSIFRNWLFDAGWKGIHQADVPVLSVGNITTGGTGKTPVVAFLANWFQGQGIKPVILSRGYRSVEGGANDEKLVLDQLCPGIVHLQNPDRAASARQAVEEHQAQVLILDDGFQHRRLARDLDLVLIDATNPWGYGAVLPRGLLREPRRSLKRADVVILTRADQISPESREALWEEIHRARGDFMPLRSSSDMVNEVLLEMIGDYLPCPRVEVAFAPRRWINARGETCELEELAGRRAVAFCGIGNPAGFQETLAAGGFSVDTDGLRTFPDHHHYSADNLRDIENWATSQRAEVVLTTQKDLVKIPQTHLGRLPLWALEIGTRFLSEAGPLLSRLEVLRDDLSPEKPVDGGKSSS